MTGLSEGPISVYNPTLEYNLTAPVTTIVPSRPNIPSPSSAPCSKYDSLYPGACFIFLIRKFIALNDNSDFFDVIDADESMVRELLIDCITEAIVPKDDSSVT